MAVPAAAQSFIDEYWGSSKLINDDILAMDIESVDPSESRKTCHRKMWRNAYRLNKHHVISYRHKAAYKHFKDTEKAVLWYKKLMRRNEDDLNEMRQQYAKREAARKRAQREEEQIAKMGAERYTERMHRQKELKKEKATDDLSADYCEKFDEWWSSNEGRRWRLTLMFDSAPQDFRFLKPFLAYSEKTEVKTFSCRDDLFDFLLLLKEQKDSDEYHVEVKMMWRTAHEKPHSFIYCNGEYLQVLEATRYESPFTSEINGVTECRKIVLHDRRTMLLELPKQWRSMSSMVDDKDRPKGAFWQMLSVADDVIMKLDLCKCNTKVKWIILHDPKGGKPREEIMALIEDSCKDNTTRDNVRDLIKKKREQLEHKHLTDEIYRGLQRLIH